MALLEIATKQYYKINFDECNVRGRRVFVNFSNYASEDERQKEKERSGAIASFFQKLRESLQKQLEAMFAKTEELGVKPEDTLSKTEEGMVDAERFPELRKMQDSINALSPYENILPDYTYCLTETGVNPLVIQAEVLDELATLL